MKKVLIVDDEAEIGLIVTKILTKNGLESDYLNRIESAKERIVLKRYDIFFLDLNLPDGSGFELIPIIRGVNPCAKIIVISAYDGISESKSIKEMKVDAFIKKPFTMKEILEVIDNQ